MKKTLLLRVAAAACLATACQPQAKPMAASAAAPAATQPIVAEAARDTSAESADLENVVVPATAAARPMALKTSPSIANLPAFLTANNLAPLWQSFGEPRSGQTAVPEVLHGFYGNEYRHIAFVLDQVQQDAAQPTLFRVRGRSRYRGTTTAFEGRFRVRSLKPLRGLEEIEVDSVALHAHAYTATASFVLREDSSAAGSGTYRGTALLDFYRLGSGELLLFHIPDPGIPDNLFPAKGGALLFKGYWQSYLTQRTQPVMFAPDARAVLPDALADLFLGERSETINPKYARLGWDEYWSNEEWWANSPKPKLSF